MAINVLKIYHQFNSETCYLSEKLKLFSSTAVAASATTERPAVCGTSEAVCGTPAVGGAVATAAVSATTAISAAATDGPAATATECAASATATSSSAGRSP